MAEPERILMPGQTRPDFVDRLGDRLVKAERDSPKTGATLWGAWRQGLKDLQNVVLNAFPDHVAQHEEPGTIANPTQLEVYDEKHAKGVNFGGEGSRVPSRHQQEVEAHGFEHGLPPQARREPLATTRARTRGDSRDRTKGRERGD